MLKELIIKLRQSEFMGNIGFLYWLQDNVVHFLYSVFEVVDVNLEDLEAKACTLADKVVLNCLIFVDLIPHIAFDVLR